MTLARGSGSATNLLNFIANGATNPTINLNNGFNSNALVTIGLDLQLSAPTTVAGSGFGTISGSISGTGGLVVNGGVGVLTLTGNNTYSGGTTINAGAVFVGVRGGTASQSSSLGTGNVTNNDTLYFNAASSAGNATITNTSVLIFSDSSTADTATIINNGGNSTFLNVQFHNGGLSIGSLSGSATVFLGNSPLTLGGLNKDDTISGNIRKDGPGPSGFTGSGGLVKIGTGTLTLTGNNNFTGATMINAGRIVAGTAAALQNSAVTVGSSATLAVGEAANTTSSAITTKTITLSSLMLTSAASSTLPQLRACE